MKKFVKILIALILIAAVAAGGFYAVKNFILKPENADSPSVSEISGTEAPKTSDEKPDITRVPYDSRNAFNVFKAHIESYESTYFNEDENKEVPTFTAYSIYDLDGDDRPEVIVYSGKTYHSAKISVLKYLSDENRVLTVDFLDDIHIGHCTFIEAPDKNGIMVYNSSMGSVTIEKAELKGNKMEVTEVHSSTDYSYGAENLDTGRRFVGDKQLALSNDEFGASFELLEDVLLNGKTSEAVIDCEINF